MAKDDDPSSNATSGKEEEIVRLGISPEAGKTGSIEDTKWKAALLSGFFVFRVVQRRMTGRSYSNTFNNLAPMVSTLSPQLDRITMAIFLSML